MAISRLVGIRAFRPVGIRAFQPACMADPKPVGIRAFRKTAHRSLQVRGETRVAS